MREDTDAGPPFHDDPNELVDDFVDQHIVDHQHQHDDNPTWPSNQPGPDHEEPVQERWLGKSDATLKAIRSKTRVTA